MIETRKGTEVDLIVDDDHTLNVIPKMKNPTLEEWFAQCKLERRHDEMDFGIEGMEIGSRASNGVIDKCLDKKTFL